MKLLTILGARPQFIKAAMVSRVIKGLEGIETLIQQEQPDWVLVYGDTNSSLAGAMAAAKLQIPLVHVEAGLRSHNPSMPEEINRVFVDRFSSLLLCPTQTAVNNLQQEGFPFSAMATNGAHAPQRIVNIGDVMYDAVLHYRERAKEQISLDAFGLTHQNYTLCTLHRQENTDDPKCLHSILTALRDIAKEIPMLLPLHPRTKHKIEQQHNADALNGITVLEPLSYLEMQRLQMSSKLILTDSGGMQKEAYFHQVPCITMRNETEWVETVEAGWNQLVGANEEQILSAWRSAKPPSAPTENLYGNGNAAELVLSNFQVES